MGNFLKFMLYGEDGTLSTSKLSSLVGVVLILHIWIDTRYLDIGYEASLIAFWLEIILILFGLRGVDRFSRYGLTDIVGTAKINRNKKNDDTAKTGEQSVVAKKEPSKRTAEPKAQAAKTSVEAKQTVATNPKKEASVPKSKQERLPIQQATIGNFQLHEFDSHDGAKMPAGAKRNVLKLIENLEIIREALGNKPITITSGYRSKAHNNSLPNPKPNSQHLLGNAADIKVKGMTPARVAKVIKSLMDEGKIEAGGLKAYKTFVHYDRRNKYVTW